MANMKGSMEVFQNHSTYTFFNFYFLSLFLLLMLLHIFPFPPCFPTSTQQPLHSSGHCPQHFLSPLAKGGLSTMEGALLGHGFSTVTVLIFLAR